MDADPRTSNPERALDRALEAAFGAPNAPDAPSRSAGASALAPGARVRHLTIVRPLGRGGMGEIHVARDERLGRDVALKAIHPEARLSDEARARFRREARILGQLDHPGICRIHDYLETPEADYLVLELVDGRPLDPARLRGRPLRALELCRRIASALEAAHRAGIVHRDLKPSNVMVTSEGGVKVLDFGVARALRDTERARPISAGTAEPPRFGGVPGLTRSGAVIGTLEYMSPEQARGEEAGAASDVYSLGLLVQELVGGAPARERGLSPLELLRRVEAGERQPIRRARADVQRLVDELCAHHPEARPSATAARERLEWILGAPRRRARRVVAAAMGLAALAAAGKYTYDLRAANATSRENLARADGLIDFMHYDLWQKLDGIGRLDVLEDICVRSSEFFESLDTAGLSDDQLMSRARTLRHFGEVWRDKADDRLDRADAAFRTSCAWLDVLVERDPAERERRFELGQAQFYVGDVAYVRRDWPEALRWFQSYHDTSAALLEETPDDGALAQEVAWAAQSLGAAHLKLSDPGEARASFAQAASSWRRMLAEEPDDPMLREELASAESWVCEAALADGDLAASAAAAHASSAAWRDAARADPEHRGHALASIVADQRVARVDLLRGRAEEAAALLERRLVDLLELVEWDPGNGEWVRTLAIHRALIASAHLALGRTEAARDGIDESLASLAPLVAVDAENPDLLYERAAARVLRAECALMGGDAVAAHAWAARALDDLGAEAPDAAPAKAAWILRASLLLAESGALLDDLWDGCQGLLARSADPRHLAPLVRLARARGASNEEASLAARLAATGHAGAVHARLVAASPSGPR